MKKTSKANGGKAVITRLDRCRHKTDEAEKVSLEQEPQRMKDPGKNGKRNKE